MAFMIQYDNTLAFKTLTTTTQLGVVLLAESQQGIWSQSL